VKRAREAIEEYQQKLKDAERNVKTYENEFIELQREIDAKKQKLEDEIFVVGAKKRLLALEANPEVAQEEPQLNAVVPFYSSGNSNGTAQNFVPELSKDVFLG